MCEEKGKKIFRCKKKKKPTICVRNCHYILTKEKKKERKKRKKERKKERKKQRKKERENKKEVS